MNFNNFIQEIEQNHWNVYGVEVYENGRLTHSYGDTEENLHAIEALVGDLPWEKLPYNPMAGAKYSLFQMDFPYDQWQQNG